MHNMNAPKDGYILPLWDGKGFYRATAQAYLRQTTELAVENRDGNWYNLKQIEDSMINPVLIPTQTINS